MEEAIDPRDILREALDEAQPHRYQATIAAAKARKEHGKPVNQRNLAQARRELTFYQHVQELIDGQPLKHEHKDRVETILADRLHDVDAAITMLENKIDDG